MPESREELPEISRVECWVSVSKFDSVGTLAFESAASANSATPGLLANLTCRAPALKHPKAGWRAGEDISLVFSPLCPSHALLSLPQSTRTQPPALLNNYGPIDSWYSFHDHFATRIVSRPDRLSRLVSQRKPASDTAKSLGMITIDPNL